MSGQKAAADVKASAPVEASRTSSPALRRNSAVASPRSAWSSTSKRRGSWSVFMIAVSGKFRRCPVNFKTETYSDFSILFRHKTASLEARLVIIGVLLGTVGQFDFRSGDLLVWNKA